MQIIRTNKFLGFVITTMGLALLLTLGAENLLNFYSDPLLLIFTIYFVIVNPVFIFFGFSVEISDASVRYRSYLVFKKDIKFDAITHVLYQPTWRNLGASFQGARSLHIVQGSGGWDDTITINAGLFKEVDLINIARTIRSKAVKAEFDDEINALMDSGELHEPQ